MTIINIIAEGLVTDANSFALFVQDLLNSTPNGQMKAFFPSEKMTNWWRLHTDQGEVLFAGTVEAFNDFKQGKMQ